MTRSYTRLLVISGVIFLFFYFIIPLQAATISFGQTISGTIAAGGENSYTFSGIAVNKILIRMSRTSGNFWPYLRLLNPSGAEIGNSWNVSNTELISISLPAAGAYTIIASDHLGNGSGGYNITLERLNPGTGGAITFGQTKSDNLAVGDLNSHIFSASAGNKVIIRMTRTSGNLWPYIRLFNPSGAEIGNSSAASNTELISILLPTTGNYTIIADDDFGTSSGGYNITLERLNPGTGGTISFSQTKSGTFAVGDLDSHIFSAAAGNKVIIRMTRTSGNLWPYIRLFNPSGAEIGNSSAVSNAELISISLPATGNYTIIVDDNFGNSSGEYNISLERLNPGTGGTISFDQTKSGTLAVGDLDSHIFSAAVGNKVIIRMSRTSGNLWPYIRLFNPAGTEIGNSWDSSNAVFESILLPVTGTYTIIADDYFGSTSGGYNLKLERLGVKFELSQQVDKYFVWPSAELAYITTYKNTGIINAANTVIEVTLPSILELVNGSISNGGTYNSTTRKIKWNIGSLNFGEAAQSVTFKAKVAAGTANGTTITLTAQITSTEKPEPTSASVTSTVALPKISSISPNKGGNAGSVKITIKGQYLDSNAEVKLSNTGQSDIIGTSVTGSPQGTQLTANFNLQGKAAGVWNLVVSNPGGGVSSLANAFIIETGGEAKLWIEIIGGERIRVGRPTEYLYRYGNSGNVNIEMCFLDLNLPENFECIKVMDRNQNVIWDRLIDADTPLSFITAPLGPGEVRELRVTLLASTITSYPLTCEAKPNAVLVPILLYFGKSLAKSAIENFFKTFIEHKWDEFGPPGQDNIYKLDWIAAFKSTWKNFISLENTTEFTCKFWFSKIKDLMTKWLEEQKKENAAKYLKKFYFTIVDIPKWVGAIKENLDKNPYFEKAASIKKEVTPVISWDPNDKIGPSGGDATGTLPQKRKRFTSKDHSFGYMVQFENLETASAAVQDMKITDQLDVNLDWATFSFDCIHIGTHTIPVPPKSQTFTTKVDFRPEMMVKVEVECTFNSSTGKAQWIFRGKHPTTGQLTDFLPPNTDNVDPKGRGWVSYSVKPKANLSSGNVIKNKATIDFEIDVPPAPMDTPEWINTIDITKPESHVLALTPTQNSPSFTVRWQGTDQHSGLGNYTIYVSDNNSSYMEWLSNTTGTSATFTGTNGHHYAFYSIARDNAGNIEDAPSSPDTTTTVSGSSTGIINLSHTVLYIGATPGNVMTPTQNVMISNSGGGILSWTATPNQNWIHVSPTNGTGNGIISVSVNASGLSQGIYNGIISVVDPNATNSPVSINVTLKVYSPGANAIPFGDFSTPTNNSTVSGSIPVTGWVLDDIGVENVKIYRQEGYSSIYIGDAIFVDGARPDVEQAYPGYPFNYRAGWGYMMLTNFLPNKGNGLFNIHAIATDMEGQQVTLGIKTINGDNANAVKPFGAIDTPIQGGTASGSKFINWGWALTPQPNYIPINGSTINVWINAVSLGHPNYNIYREDIAGLLPGYANSNGSAGYYYLDTTAYENGVHTIFWTATDSAGNADGIGSRYFTIQNTGNDRFTKNQNGASEVVNSTDELWDNLAKIPPDYFEPIQFKKGYCQNHELKAIYPNDKGMITITIKELERIEVKLFPEDESTVSSDPRLQYSGYIIMGDQLKPLPIGSTVDNQQGTFYWQPGPGFIGEYRFVFIKKGEAGINGKKYIIIKIVPISNKIIE